MCVCLCVCVIGRTVSEERASAEERAAEVERKLSDLTSRINSMIHIDVTVAQATYSAEQTLNTVSSFVVCSINFLLKTSKLKE